MSNRVEYTTKHIYYERMSDKNTNQIACIPTLM